MPKAGKLALQTGEAVAKPFKVQLVARCRRPGASVGSVALVHGRHSNMMRRWIREARQDQAFALSAGQGEPAAFVALPPPVSTAGQLPGAAPTLLQLRLERSD